MHKLKWVGVLVLAVVLLGTVKDTLSQEGGPVVLTAAITSSQEVPAPQAGVPAGAVGHATLLFDPADNTATFLVAYRDLNSPLSLAHFHQAAAGTAGGVVQTICGQPAPALAGDCPSGGNAGVLQGVWDVPADLVPELLTGGIYINLHTAENPPGEIRGQIFPQ